MNKFKERLKFLRTNKKLSQGELGSILGYTRFAISDWERGRSEPNIEAIIKIAKYFNESTDFLLGVDQISIDK